MVKVLVVEDDRVMQQIFSEVLRIDGHEIICSGDGEDAVRKLSTHHPDVMLLDMNLPKLSGYEVIQYVQDAGVYENLKIVITTANNNIMHSPEAELADVVMIKPIGMPELRAMVIRLAGIRTV